jgi:DNA modification methylase
VLAGLDPQEVVLLDPFSGVGTTLVEGFKRGFSTIGFEINPFAALVCGVKLRAGQCDLRRLRAEIPAFVEWLERSTENQLPAHTHRPSGFRSRDPFFSPAIEPQILLAKDYMADLPEVWLQDMFRVALGAILVEVSNYSYEPSLGRRVAAGKPEVLSADVAQIMGAKLVQIADDVETLQDWVSGLSYVPKSEMHRGSYLDGARMLPRGSISLLVTSPPYLNNYHYIRNTRPHLFWLDLVHDTKELKALECGSFGKFWQTVRAGPPVLLDFDCPELREPLAALAGKNAHKGVYGGIGWANYAASYFNDCDRFCRETLSVMKPRGRAFVVIGNNILQGIEFKTDEIFARIAERRGFKVLDIHAVREKRTGNSILNSSVRNGETTAKVRLYESAVELQAPD